ncbi:uncharacterized protein LOC127280797 [Leptopilina boulardi]|uniref:uncharacterized protein LOC127280797 n=1 Tax=Leptopilina boulardi TaxID=63433 RepID=UPI0021F51F13|nr:uncharacterized protein LOC127280797 [Leptopilina boulardi]
MNSSKSSEHSEKINDDANFSNSETPVVIGDQNLETTIEIIRPEITNLTPPREFILTRNLAYRSLNRSWISKCCNTSESDEIGQPYSRGAPPSYSSIFVRPRPNRNDVQFSFLPFDSQSSFEVYTPPPSYAQAQGIFMDSLSMDNLISTTSSSGRFLSSQPTLAICPRCATYTLTIVQINRSILAHVIAIILFISGSVKKLISY